MKNFLFIIICSLSWSNLTAQIDCSMLGMTVNVSDTGKVVLYHSGPYLLWPRDPNVIYWDITDLQGGPVAQDTTYGQNAGHYNFHHSVPLTDSMVVSAVIINDSVYDMSTGNSSSMACQNIDTLYWKPDTIIPGTILYRWEFVGGSNGGVSVLSINEKDADIAVTRIYPNPASSNLLIDNLSEGIRSITIFNSYGQQIFTSESPNQNIGINVESWPAGQYVVWINQTPTQLINVVH